MHLAFIVIACVLVGLRAAALLWLAMLAVAALAWLWRWCASLPHGRRRMPARSPATGRGRAAGPEPAREGDQRKDADGTQP